MARRCAGELRALRRDVDCGFDAVVALSGFVQRVADRREPDAARDGDRAHHVQDDADLALAVPTETLLLDDVEEIVRRQRLVRP